MIKYEEPKIYIFLLGDLQDVVTLSNRNDIDIDNEQGEDGSWLL